MTVTYFEEAPEQGGRGLYRTLTGAVVKIDLTHRVVLLREGERMVRIGLCDVCEYDIG